MQPWAAWWMTARSAKCRSTVEAGTLWLTPFRGWSNTPAPAVASTAVRARTNSALPARAAIPTASLLDGTDVNDSSNSTPGGAAGTNLGVDAIKEFKIVAATFSAEYGRASGAVVSAVTRSGTNDLHGTLFEFHRNSAFDARTIFDLEDHDGDGKADLPPFHRNQFGGVLGGPIKKDKTFFFGGYEGFRQSRSETTIAVVPTIAAKRGILPCAPPANRLAGSDAARLCPGSPINSSGSYGTYRVTPSSKIIPFFQYYPDPNGQIFKNRATGDDLYIGEFVGSPKSIVRQDFFMGRVDHQLTTSTNIFGR